MQQKATQPSKELRGDLRALMAATDLRLPDTRLLGPNASRLLRHVQLEHFARLAATPPEGRPRDALKFLRTSIETDIRVTLLWNDLRRLQLRSLEEPALRH